MPSSKRQLKPRTHGGGRYTQAGYWGFIRSGLRNKYNRWGPKYDVLKKAKRKSQIEGDKKTKWQYQCALCKDWFKAKQVQVDHVEPCGSLKCKEDLPGFVTRLFCEEDNLRVLCLTCHKERD